MGIQTAELLKQAPKLSDAGRYLLTLFVSLALYLLMFTGLSKVLYTQSFRSLDHHIHAIEIGPWQSKANNNFIYGGDLSCRNLGSGSSCRAEVDGKLLTVRTYRFAVVDGTIGSCDARFDDRNIGCEPSYPTSSYWAHGVRIENDALEAAFANEPRSFNWRALLIESNDLHAMQLVLTLATATTFGAIVVGPMLLSRYTPLSKLLYYRAFNLRTAVFCAVVWIVSVPAFMFWILGYGFMD